MDRLHEIVLTTIPTQANPLLSKCENLTLLLTTVVVVPASHRCYCGQSGNTWTWTLPLTRSGNTDLLWTHTINMTTLNTYIMNGLLQHRGQHMFVKTLKYIHAVRLNLKTLRGISLNLRNLSLILRTLRGIRGSYTIVLNTLTKILAEY